MADRLFELFDAPLSEALDYVGQARCDLCGREYDHCFTLGAGACSLTPCPQCRELVLVDSRPAIALRCRACNTLFNGPKLPEEPTCCALCLREGRAAMTKGTELGRVRWEDAMQGWTHGLPGFESCEWEVSPSNENGWYRVRVPSEHLLKLVRTPTYATLQGEHWLFCCQEPMIFLGEWTRARFTEEAPDGCGAALLDQCVGEHFPGLWEDELRDVTGIYVFGCARCGKRRAHWDIA